MKKILLIALVVITSCNGPKDPPDDGTVKVDVSGIRVDTTTITTNARLQKVVDSLEANK